MAQEYIKASDLTVTDVIDYLHITELDISQESLLNTILESARNYAVSSTGQELTELDNYPDITLAILAICQDLYDNRSIYVDKNNLNDTITTILGFYRVNLL